MTLAMPSIKPFTSILEICDNYLMWNAHHISGRGSIIQLGEIHIVAADMHARSGQNGAPCQVHTFASSRMLLIGNGTMLL